MTDKRTTQESALQVEHHTVEQDGYHWHVVTSGPSDAPPLLMLHCWTGNWTEWQRTMRHLSGRYRFIVPDHLGSGGSDKPRGDYYAIAAQAERALNLLRYFGYDRARVIGHSMGGQIALTLAGLYPDAVERLVVVAPAVTGKLHPLSALVGSIAANPVRRGITFPVLAAIGLAKLIPILAIPPMRVYFPNPFAQREAALYWAGQLTADGQIYAMAWMHKAILSGDTTPHLAKITAPTLAIWGEKDSSIPVSECDVLAKHIPAFSAVRIPKIGHFPMIEAWDQYSQAVREFLQV